MSQQLKRTIILLLIFILTASSCLCTLMLYSSNNNEKNNQMQNSYSGIYKMLCYFGIFILTISSTYIYLNLINKVSRNKFFKFLSFFLLPIMLSSFEMIPRLLRGNEREIQIMYPIIVPFFLSLFASYIYFILINDPEHKSSLKL